MGRPDTFSVLAALAAVTDHLGLVGTINSTFNEPFDVAREFATLDHLSDGRAGWNVVTSWDAFTGENFRRGGYLAQEDRYTRAQSFLSAARELWNSWSAGDLGTDSGTDPFVTDPAAGSYEFADRHFDIRGRFSVPRSPQGNPVVFQAGDSDEGREFAAANADAIFSRHSTYDAGRAFYTDVKRRLAQHGRSPEDLLILPGATFVVGDTDHEAQEQAHAIRRQQVSGQTAINVLEQLWNRDLSSYDPEGPLPEVDPVPGQNTLAKGRASVRRHEDVVATAREWRERAVAEKLSIRELVIEVTGRQSFVGSPLTIASQLNHFVQNDACDGFILVPHLTPTGLDPFVDRVIPLLQELGVYRTSYEGTTLRENLGLPPLRDGVGSARAHGVAS
ncbi:nitrilotriacetate monooxygenase component A [Flexivirga endophytica]|nr:nitrilotriacetate monooxygenase component A [Flexivirga endophytica]